MTSAYASLRYPAFRKLLAANALLTVAREAQIVVIGWQVFAITKDPLTLGLIGISEALPFIGVALFAGHVADRFDRRRVALLGLTGLLLSSIGLLMLSNSWAQSTAPVVWPAYAIIAAGAAARSFTRPAIFALSAEVIPRELYPNAVAWRSSAWHIAAVAGPAGGGLLYGFAGPQPAFIAVIAAMALSLVTLFLMDYRAVPREIAVPEPLRESLLGGLRFVWSEPVLLSAMALDLFAVLFGGAVALLPAFASLLDAGPEGLGLLRAAPATGAIVTGLWIAHRPPMRRAGPVLLISVALFGLCIVLFAISRIFWLSFVLLLASGIVDNISVVIRATLLQTRTPEALLGRVAAVNQTFIGASNEIGAFESGVAARLMGLVPSVLFGGFMTLLVVTVIAWRSPGLRRLRDLSPAT